MREARDIVVFLLSLHAVGHALFAWDRRALEQPRIVGGWTFAPGPGVGVR